MIIWYPFFKKGWTSFLIKVKKRIEIYLLNTFILFTFSHWKVAKEPLNNKLNVKTVIVKLFLVILVLQPLFAVMILLQTMVARAAINLTFFVAAASKMGLLVVTQVKRLLRGVPCEKWFGQLLAFEWCRVWECVRWRDLALLEGYRLVSISTDKKLSKLLTVLLDRTFSKYYIVNGTLNLIIKLLLQSLLKLIFDI